MYQNVVKNVFGQLRKYNHMYFEATAITTAINQQVCTYKMKNE